MKSYRKNPEHFLAENLHPITIDTAISKISKISKIWTKRCVVFLQRQALVFIRVKCLSTSRNSRVSYIHYYFIINIFQNY